MWLLINTSALATNASNSARAASSVRSKKRCSFPKLTLLKYALTFDPGSSVGSFHFRVTSPPALGFSTFTTRAPSSAKNMPTAGPASTLAVSITKRSFSMGRM